MNHTFTNALRSAQMKSIIDSTVRAVCKSSSKNFAHIAMATAKNPLFPIFHHETIHNRTRFETVGRTSAKAGEMKQNR